MASQPVIRNPGSIVAGAAVAFGIEGDRAVMVDARHPLPVELRTTAPPPPPLAGTMTAAGQAGPFVPLPGRPVVVTLAREWAGRVTLLRSADGGATRIPLTYADGSPRGTWSGNVNAPAHEESVAGTELYLDFVHAGGVLAFRMEQ